MNICNSKREIKDHFGENTITLRCQHLINHEGEHEQPLKDCIVRWSDKVIRVKDLQPEHIDDIDYEC